MAPEHARIFGTLGNTGVNPIALALTVVAVILMLVLPRKHAVVPFLFAVLLIPSGQGPVFGGAHFFTSRLIILAGLLRVITTKEKGLRWGRPSIGRLAIGYLAGQVIATSLLFLNTAATINQVAIAIDTIGAFILLRFFIQTREDVYRVIKCLAVVSVIAGFVMVVEQVKYQNLFFYIGGRAAPEIRDGAVRSQGPFMHALTAGTFAGTVLPLFLLLWAKQKNKLISVAGLAGSTLMMVASHSSTPMLAYAGGIGAILLWPIRKKMRAVRWGIVATLVGLALVMKAPVWFIIAHVDLTGSSSSYHRAVLVDAFVRHFWDWFLIGVKDSGVWGYDVWDAQNQYVSVGESGGLAALVLFIATISRCFSLLGKARRAVEGNAGEERGIWFLGAALFAHVMGFFGVNYFDQSQINWLVILNVIAAVTVPILSSPRTSRTKLPVLVGASPRLGVGLASVRTGGSSRRSLESGALESRFDFRRPLS